MVCRISAYLIISPQTIITIKLDNSPLGYRESGLCALPRDEKTMKATKKSNDMISAKFLHHQARKALKNTVTKFCGPFRNVVIGAS